MSIRVLLADDHKIMRDGLRSLLEGLPDMEVVGEGDNGRTTVELVKELSPDVVIMDIGMPDLNGLEATRQIIAHSKGVKVIALSMHSDSPFVSGMLKAGAVGYLLKNSAFEELARAIRAVVNNHSYLSPGISDVVIKDYVDHLSPGTVAGGEALSDREREVLQLIAEGRSTKDIAGQLHVSVKTVETHRQRIMHRLGIHSVAELTKYAIRERLTELE